MRNIKFPLAAMLLAFVVLAPACKKDKEADREKFLGTYSVVESCPSFGVANYDISIATSATGDNAVVVSNFGNFGVSATGTVSGSALTIPQQTVTVQGNAVGISATGTINGNSLSITYTFSVGGVGETCSMVCNKK